MQSSKAAAEGVIERFYLAVYELAVGQGDVRNRLLGAGLQLLPILPTEVPEEIRKDFEWTIDQLTRFPDRYEEGTLRATLRRIRKSTGQKIAKRIFDMFSELEKLRGTPLL